MRRRLTPPCVARVNASVLHSSRYCRAVYVEHSARSARSRHGPRQVHGGSTVSIEPPLHHPTSPPIFGTHRTHHPWGAASVNLDALLTHTLTCQREKMKKRLSRAHCQLSSVPSLSQCQRRIPKGAKRPPSCMSREFTLFIDRS